MRGLTDHITDHPWLDVFTTQYILVDTTYQAIVAETGRFMFQEYSMSSNDCPYCQKQNLLTSNGINLYLSESEIVYHQGDITRGGYVLCKGAIMIYRRVVNGSKRVVSLVRPGDYFGVESLSQEKVRFASAKTIIPSVVHVIYDKDFYTSMYSDQFYTVINTSIAKFLCDLSRDITISTYGGADAKIASFLYLLFENYGIKQPDASIHIPWPVTQDWLAQSIGLRRETVARTVQNLKKQGILLWERRRISVTDLDQLRALFEHL